MKMLLLLMITFFIAGCSGKVQTNPLPSEEKMYFPNSYISNITNEVEKDKLNNFSDYVRKELQPFSYQDEQKDIWQIGKEIEESGKI